MPALGTLWARNRQGQALRYSRDGFQLLPLAADRGMAVIANRPFRRKELIDRFAPHPLPDWAAEIDCANWPQFLLKIIVSHPAVTCAIPATSRVDHAAENMGALRGRLPDEAPRPQPEHAEPRLQDPSPTELSKRDYVAIVKRAARERSRG